MSTQPQLPADHAARMERALLSFDGLSVGDGFGECFFISKSIVEQRISEREAPPAPWTVTDDSMMALSIVHCLQRDGRIHSDTLAKAFAREYARDPLRGSTVTAQGIAGVFAGESFGERVGMDATIALKAVNNRERHHGVVRDGPWRRRRFAFADSLLDDRFADEKAFPEAVANRKAIEREKRAFHARGVIGWKLWLRAHVLKSVSAKAR